MKLKFSKSIIALIITFTVTDCFSSKCDHPLEDDDINQCLGGDLYAADVNLNLSYKTLADSLQEPDKDKLKIEQIAWIKERNAVCNLDAKETDRESWHKDIIKDATKTQCVIRYSKARTIELNEMLVRQQAKTASLSYSYQDYIISSGLGRKSGLWYFETKLNPSEIARTAPASIRVGCGIDKGIASTGFSLNIRPGNPNGEILIATAVDLEHGKIYQSINGDWRNGKPGSSDGIDIKLGQPWQCGIESTELLALSIKKKNVGVNFGEHPFIYQPPAGYKPYRGEPIWMLGGVGSDGTRLSFDYKSFNIKNEKPSFTARQEYTEWKPLNENDRKYKATWSEMEVDCNTMKAADKVSFFVADDNTYVANSAYPFNVDQQSGLENIGGRLVKTLCFLHENNFTLPDIGITDIWEPMLSPTPTMKISEATIRRQYKNGELLVKQKNEMDTEDLVFNESSKLRVGISAYDCKQQTMYRLMSIRYGNNGSVGGADYYSDSNIAPKLPQNKERFDYACATLSSMDSAK